MFKAARLARLVSAIVGFGITSAIAFGVPDSYGRTSVSVQPKNYHASIRVYSNGYYSAAPKFVLNQTSCPPYKEAAKRVETLDSILRQHYSQISSPQDNAGEAKLGYLTDVLMKQQVVVVAWYEGEQEGRVGYGIRVATDSVLTVDHILTKPVSVTEEDGSISEKIKTAYSIVVYDMNGRGRYVDTGRTNPINDAALLHVSTSEDSEPTGVKLGVSDSLFKGQSILVMSPQYQLDSGIKVDPGVHTTSHGYVTAAVDGNVLTTVKAPRGVSGSSVFNLTGGLVGLIIVGFDDYDDLKRMHNSEAVNTIHLADLMRDEANKLRSCLQSVDKE